MPRSWDLSMLNNFHLMPSVSLGTVMVGGSIHSDVRSPLFEHHFRGKRPQKSMSRFVSCV